MPSRQPRVPSIGFASRQNSDAFSSFVSASLRPVLGLLDDQLLVIGQELVQRRVEQAHRDRQAVHRLEDAVEVGFLLRAQLLERGVFVGVVVGEDHALHDREPVAEEHVLGAAQADALGAELARLASRLRGGRRSCAPSGAGSWSAQPRIVPKWPVGSGVITATSPTTISPDVPEIEMTSPSCTVTPPATNCLRREIDHHGLGAADRGLAHAARDDRRVRHETAARREDALGRDHAVQVVGRRLGPHEDHVLAGLVARLGLVGGEVHLADRRARRRVQALGEHA